VGKVEYLELLYDALRTPFGLVVETNDAERLRQKLYSARKEVAEFECLSFVISPLNGVDLWILKKGLPDEREA
jgi:hypothetical protein